MPKVVLTKAENLAEAKRLIERLQKAGRLTISESLPHFMTDAAEVDLAVLKNNLATMTPRKLRRTVRNLKVRTDAP